MITDKADDFDDEFNKQYGLKAQPQVQPASEPVVELRSMSRSQLMRLRGDIAEILLERLDEPKAS